MMKFHIVSAKVYSSICKGLFFPRSASMVVKVSMGIFCIVNLHISVGTRGRFGICVIEEAPHFLHPQA